MPPSTSHAHPRRVSPYCSFSFLVFLEFNSHALFWRHVPCKRLSGIALHLGCHFTTFHFKSYRDFLFPEHGRKGVLTIQQSCLLPFCLTSRIMNFLPPNHSLHRRVRRRNLPAADYGRLGPETGLELGGGAAAVQQAAWFALFSVV